MTKKPAQNEVLKVLERSDATTIDVLKCSDLSTVYRQNDQKLMQFLMDPKHIRDIYDILMRTGARYDHKRIMTLYQTSNTSLHRVFADSIPLTEYAFTPLSKNDDKSGYAAGTISRMLSRALDTWSDEIYDIFHYSDMLYKIVIENIDKSVVYMTLCGIISEANFLFELMWYLFKALAGKDYNKHPPRCCYLSKDIPDLKPLDNEAKKLNAISILKQFFGQNKPKTEDFAELILDFVVSVAQNQSDTNKFYYQYFDLAKNAGFDARLQDIAINNIKTAAANGQLNSPLIVTSASYLEICARYFDEITAESIIATLLDKTVNQNTLLSVVIMAKNITIESPSWVGQFKDKLKQIFMCAWNHFNDQPLITSIIFDMTITLHLEDLNDKNYENDLKDWKKPDFLLSSAPNTELLFNLNFKFPETSYNIEEINKLRWGDKF